MKVSLHNRPEDIPLVHQALDELARQHHLPARLVNHLHLALEEHLTNVISYGYDPGQTGAIDVRFMLETSAIRVQVEDNARPFNPLAAPEVDTSLPLEAKPLGGLGLLMLRKSADELDYHRTNDRNLLTIKKRLN